MAFLLFTGSPVANREWNKKQCLSEHCVYTHDFMPLLPNAKLLKCQCLLIIILFCLFNWIEFRHALLFISYIRGHLDHSFTIHCVQQKQKWTKSQSQMKIHLIRISFSFVLSKSFFVTIVYRRINSVRVPQKKKWKICAKICWKPYKLRSYA